MSSVVKLICPNCGNVDEGTVGSPCSAECTVRMISAPFEEWDWERFRCSDRTLDVLQAYLYVTRVLARVPYDPSADAYLDSLTFPIRSRQVAAVLLATAIHISRHPGE